MKRWFAIDDRSAIASLRRHARRCGVVLGLSDRRLDELAIVATEAATNTLRHGQGGRALIQMVRREGEKRLELIFADRGPGISDVAAMMVDGVSGIKSAGLGLGSMQRLSDHFDIHSTPGQGTVLAITFEGPAEGASRPLPDVAALLVCHPAEQLCGDGWLLRRSEGYVDVLLCDGLGHGRRAHEAAEEVIKIAKALQAPPAETIRGTSAAMVGHRGAVAAMVRLDFQQRKIAYAGLGNITTVHISRDVPKRFAVRDGRIGGAEMSGFEEVRDAAPGDLILMHSDGLKTLRETDLPKALLRKSTVLIAGYLMHFNFRGRDDGAIVVFRVPSEQEAN